MRRHMQHTFAWAAALLVGTTFVRGDASYRFPKGELTTPRTAQRQTRVTVPAGTRILVRTNDALEARNQREGARFTATLETNVQAEGRVVAPRGATVHGRVVKAKSAGRRTGSSQLTIELTDIVINGTAYPIVTDQYEIRGRGEGRSTARRVVGGTGLGTLVGGIAGGGRGAGVGAVAGAGAGTVASSAKGEQVSLTQQSLIEFRLGHPVALPVGT